MLPYVLVIGLAIYSLIDLSRSTASERAGVHPFAWVLIVLVPVLGPAAWLLVSRYQRGDIGPPPGERQGRPAAPPRPPAGPTRRRRPAPDDDPDFLRRLGRPGRPPRRRPDDDTGPAGDARR